MTYKDLERSIKLSMTPIKQYPTLREKLEYIYRQRNRSKWPNNSIAAKLVSTELEKVGIQVSGWEIIDSVQEILYNVSFSNGLLNKPLHNVTRKYQNFEFKTNKEFLPQVVDFLAAANLANPALTFDNESLRETFENRVEVSPFASAWEAASGMSHSTEFEQIACLVKEQKSYPTITSLKNLTMSSERERTAKELQDRDPCYYCGETTHRRVVGKRETLGEMASIVRNTRRTALTGLLVVEC
mmetsp:Transcript_43674/g.61378  ORF Transcript_43674/g.61378 Transcript_43674/m.61378 type:complete len:242 (-) Transcript_43674:115-840(-)